MKKRCGRLWKGACADSRTDHIDVLVWHGHSSPEEVSDPNLFEFMSKMKKEGKVRFTGFSCPQPYGFSFERGGEIESS